MYNKKVVKKTKTNWEDIDMALWGGRFEKEMDEIVKYFNASIFFDQKMYKEDIQGSIAHVTMLAKQGILCVTFADMNGVDIQAHAGKHGHICFGKGFLNGCGLSDFQFTKSHRKTSKIETSLFSYLLSSMPQRDIFVNGDLSFYPVFVHAVQVAGSKNDISPAPAQISCTL